MQSAQTLLKSMQTRRGLGVMLGAALIACSFSVQAQTPSLSLSISVEGTNHSVGVFSG